MRELTLNQKALAREIVKGEDRFVLALGDIGTGKTATSLWAFLIWSMQFANCTFGFIALTQILVRQKLWPEIRKFCIDMNLNVPKIRNNMFSLCGNNYLILSGQNARSADYIQGLDLQGAFVDEATTIPHQVVDELNNRLRQLPGAKMILTANPASPTNKYGLQFKRRWFDRINEIGMKVMYLVVGDNPKELDDYYESQAQTGTHGSRARRLGGGTEWIADEGRVYPVVIRERAPSWDKLSNFMLSVDIAISSVTHAGLFAKDWETNIWWLIDEWRHDGEQDGTMPVSDQAKEIASWVRRLGVDVDMCFFDTSHPGFGIELYRQGISVKKARKDREEGFDKTRNWLENGHLRLDNKVKHAYDELVALSFNPLWTEKGIDKETLGSDHGPDMVRYLVYTLSERR